MKHQIAIVSDRITDQRRSQIEAAAAEGNFELAWFQNEEEASGHLGDCEIVFTNKTSVAAEATSAKWVASYNAGIDPFLEPGILQPGQILSKGAGMYGVAIAEHILCVTIALMKRFPEYLPHIQAQEWFQGLEISSLYGSRVTIVGTGDIGKNTAQRLRGFEPQTISGVNHSGREVEFFDRIVTNKEIDQVLPETDVLILAAPDTEETRGMIGREQLALLPENAYVINVGRGSAIDQDALIEALNTDKLAGASLDVMMPEPLPKGHPLWTAKNVILTPHISGQQTLQHTVDKGIELFCENLGRYIRGEELENTVDFELGY